MFNMKKIIEKIENLNISFWYMIAMFCFAITIRTFLENFTSLNYHGRLNGFINIFIHQPLWYIAVFLGLAGIIYFFSKKPLSKVMNIISFGSFVIILPTIIDFLFYRQKIAYEYITGSWSEIFRQYYTLLIGNTSFGVGIKTEIIIVLISIFYYVYSQKKELLKSIIAVFASYTLIFIMLIIPNILYFIVSFFNSLPVLTSLSIKHFFLSTDLNNQFVFSKAYLSETTFDGIKGVIQNLMYVLMAQSSFYMLLLFSCCLTLIKFGMKKTGQLFGNFRWLRIAHYFVLLFFGIMIGQKNLNSISGFHNIYDWFSLFSTSFSLLFAWLFAVWENDEVDKNIDQLSNTDRPLVKKIFTDIEWNNMKWVFFVLSIISAILSGYSTLPTIIVFLVIYHIYSVYPLRLKRYPIISSALVSINACLAFMLGFFLVSGNEPFNILPIGVLSGIFIFYLCVENIKNLKDIAGDTKEKIITVPVIFGEKKGKIITWILVLLGTFTIPLMIFSTKQISWLGPVFGALSYFLIVRRNYKEKPLFLLYLCGFLLLMFW